MTNVFARRLSSDAEETSSSKGIIAGVVIVVVLLACLAGLFAYLYLRRSKLSSRKGDKRTNDVEAAPPSATLTGRFSRFSGKDHPQFKVVPFDVSYPLSSATPTGRSNKEWEAMELGIITQNMSSTVSPMTEGRLSQMIFAEAPPAYSDSVEPSEYGQDSPVQTNPSTATFLTYRTVYPSPLQKTIAVPWNGTSSSQSSPVNPTPSRNANNGFKLDVKVDPFAKSTGCPSPVQEEGSVEEVSDRDTQLPPPHPHIEEPPQLHLRAQTPFRMAFRESSFPPSIFDMKALRKSTFSANTASASVSASSSRASIRTERSKTKGTTKAPRQRNSPRTDKNNSSGGSPSFLSVPFVHPLQEQPFSSSHEERHFGGTRNAESIILKVPVPPLPNKAKHDGRRRRVREEGDATSRASKRSREAPSAYASFLPDMNDS
jgi:hypothetical protein